MGEFLNYEFNFLNSYMSIHIIYFIWAKLWYIFFSRKWSILSNFGVRLIVVFPYYLSLSMVTVPTSSILILVVCVFSIFLLSKLEVCQFYWPFQGTTSFSHWFAKLFFSVFNSTNFALISILSFCFWIYFVLHSVDWSVNLDWFETFSLF